MEIERYRPIAAVEPSLSQVAEWLEGELLDAPDPSRTITGLGTLARATETEAAFVAGQKFIEAAEDSPAALLIVGARSDLPGRPRVVVSEVWQAVVTLMRHLYPEPAPHGEIHPTAVIGLDVELGERVSVGPYSVIGDGAEIGDDAVIGAHCVVGPGCTVGAESHLVANVTLVRNVFLGQRVLIHPGAVLGADGFKFELIGGKPAKIPQVGAVVVEDDVEIGANTTIDRAFLYETRVGRGVKIDNQVQLGHNVEVGEGSIMASQVGVAGSTKIGRGCLLGGQVGLRDGINIADGTIISAKTGVFSDLEEPGAAWGGYPQRSLKQFWRLYAVQGQLPEMAKRLRRLEQQLEASQPSDESK